MVIFALILLGLCFGSFVNALVWRLRQQSLPKKKQAATPDELSITKGRSMCPHCKHTLGVLDLLPLISWIALCGRCRYCKEPIGWQYPIVEALTAILFVASYSFWPFELEGQGIFLLVCWLIALVGLMALMVYDMRWMLLPNKIVFPLVALGIIQTAVICLFFGGGLSYLLGTLFSVLVAGGIFYALFQLSGGRWIGGGDVKLGYAIGLLLASPSLSFLMLFVASLIGVAAALPGLITKKMTATTRIPFGPFLIVATIIIMLFGTASVDWYLHHVLYLP